MLNQQAIIANLSVSDKKQALLAIAEKASSIVDLSADEIFDVLRQREQLGTTGVGNGIAIPHGKFENLDTIVGFFTRLKTPIDFNAVDEEPVDLIFTILAPADAGADHLKALAQVSRQLRDKSICKKLRGADSAEALYVLLVTPPESNVA